ncbi:MAG TPA: thiamine biosynthesis protein ThiS [Spirochaetia bacterium]|nr:thiamine biosynthesis protein ThiS [Spirochaetia bacterium]
MKIVINGKETLIEKEQLSMRDLLVLQNVKMPEAVSVELNGEFLNRSEFASKTVKDNDVIEFLYFMGGGK